MNPGPGTEGSVRTLDDLRPGEAGVIVRIDREGSVARRLMELGLVPGTAVEVVRYAPLGDPMELRIRRIHISIRRREAARIHVKSR